MAEVTAEATVEALDAKQVQQYWLERLDELRTAIKAGHLESLAMVWVAKDPTCGCGQLHVNSSVRVRTDLIGPVSARLVTEIEGLLLIGEMDGQIVGHA